MQEHELIEVIRRADAAINREDLDAVMDFYADGATLVVRPGLLATGKDQIRRAFEAIFNHFNHSLHVQQTDLTVIEGGDTALVLGKATISSSGGNAPTVEERRPTYVFQKKLDGTWRCTVDNSYGVTLVG